MYIATGLTDVVTFCATPDELAPENREQLGEKIKSQPSVIFGSDIIADMGAKVRFIDEPVYEVKEDTLITCTIRVRLTVNKDIAAITGIPKTDERDFVAYAKCSESDKENYDPAFGKRIALNKAKINAYSYYMRMFIRHIEKIHRNMVGMVGFTKKMEKLINGNAKYIFDLCEERYPGECQAEDPCNAKGSEQEGTADNIVSLNA